jgi:hypothetical protein
MTEDAAVIENLELLRREWGHGYLIWFEAGLYCARRRDNTASCRRLKAEDLRAEIATDHRAYPVGVEIPSPRATAAHSCRSPARR